MSNRFLYLVLVLLLSVAGYGQIKMGNSPLNINPNSLLELEDTTRGFVLPRMNSTNMNSINTGLVGMLVFNTDNNCIHQLTPGNTWKSLCALDSLELAKAIMKAPARDSVLKIINNAILAGTLNGKNVTSGALITLSGTPIGASVKDFGISINTTALKDSIAIYVSNSNTVRDSLISLISSTLTADNGLTKTGTNFKLGGTLIQPTSITTTGANTLAISGLQSGTVADSILVADASTGVMRRRSPAAILGATTTNVLTISGNTITSNVNGISSSSTLIKDDSTTASNGLNLVGKDVRMGGALTSATSITTTGANTLAISGLQSGTAADSILVADASTGVMRRRSPAAILGATTTNVLTISGNTITSNVNGISSSSTLIKDDSTTASNGLNLVGKDVRMGGALTSATSITTTGANTLAISGLQSGTVADSILVADASTGVMRRRSPAAILGATTTNVLTISGNTITSNVNGISSSSTLIKDDSTTASNGLNLVGKDVRMGGALTSATSITTTGANTLAISGLQSGTVADSILVADASTGVMRRRSPAAILGATTTNVLTISGNTITSNVNGISSSSTLIKDDSTTASNGLNLVGKDVRMGGALTSATSITTTGANTLAISGLQSGTVADSILVADASTGVMRRRSPAAILGATTTNVLTISGNTITSNVNGVSSSSTLIKDDSTTASNGLNLVGKDVRMGGALTSATSITTTGANTLAISGLQSGTVADSILVADASTGVMRRRSPAAILGATTTNVLTISGNTITSNVNGVSSSSTLIKDDSTTASNGLNLVGKDVRMGGALTSATSITTTGANTLAISGLQSGTVADSILVADASTGVMRRRSPSTILAGATTNNLSYSGNTLTSNVNGVSSNVNLFLADSTTASNGLNLVGKDVRMGGALTSATSITTTGANTLAISGLQSGTVADSILVADASTGVMRRRSPSTILAGATTNNLSYSGNTLTSNVNGVSSNVNLFLADSTTASNGLNLIGKDVRMGGALTSATSITTTGANTLAISGLQSGTVADSILVADASTGVMRRRSPSTILAGATTNNLSYSGNTLTSNVNGVSSNVNLFLADSTTASNGLNLVGKDVRMGGALTSATSITTTGANTLAISGLQSGTVADSILVADASTGVMRRRSPSTILAGATTNNLSYSGNTLTSNVNGVSSNVNLFLADSTTASNGLNLVGKDVRMGGALTSATSITTTGANTLAISGLQSGTAADSILVADASTGVMRRRSPSTILAGATTNNLSYSGNTLTSNVNGVSSNVNLFLADSTTASNGLNLVGKDVRMGGALTSATSITTTGANTLAISGLQSGTAADSILVADASTGVMRRRSPSTILTDATTNTLNSLGNISTSIVNGISDTAKIINSNILSVTGNTLTSNINGVSSSTTLSLADSTTASNGLNIVGRDVQLGGALTSPTTITTSATNTLSIKGLQTGSPSDSTLVVDTNGVVRRKAVPSGTEVVNISAAYTVQPNDLIVVINCSGPFNITLPTPTPQMAGRTIYFASLGSSTADVAFVPANLATFVSLYQTTLPATFACTLICTGSKWAYVSGF